MKKRVAIGIMIFGLFLQIATIPFMENYNPRIGVILNIQRMEYSIYKKTRPDFRIKYGIDVFDNIASKIIRHDDTGIYFIFPLSLPESEIKEIINYQFPLGSNIPKVSQKQYWEYNGWYLSVIKIQYRYIFLAGILIIFIGALILLFSNIKKAAS